MKEEFLQFIWKYQLFSSEKACTITGESIQIVDVGTHNQDAGPDFFDARVRIDGILWAGNVEIHLKASDWYRHGHHFDPAYENVILHVVGESDEEVVNEKGRVVPCMKLVYPKALLQQYQNLSKGKRWIPCQEEIQSVDRFFVDSWLDRMLVERLERKAKSIVQCLKRNQSSWEESFYQHLTRNFGMKVNADPFELLARSLPLKYLARQKNSKLQLEALLFGQAGFMEADVGIDEYFTKLKEEYKFLRRKYALRPLQSSIWKFLRLRPNNFPTIRIAQLAALIHQSRSLFSKVLEAEELSVLKELFKVEVSDYWCNHYGFGKTSSYSQRAMGQNFVNGLLINTVVPYLFVYGRYYKKYHFEERALKFLELIHAENNHVIRGWKALGVAPASAFYSQALLQLKMEYCDVARCLECELGNRILRTSLVAEK